MGSPILKNIAEIYLRFFEELTIRHWVENGEVLYYRRRVDDIIIIFDQNKINEELITNYMNNIQGAAEWTPTFLKVTGKGVVGVGRRGRWQRFGRIV